MDGTTKMIVYKPEVNTEDVIQNANLTIDDLNKCMQKYDHTEKFEELKKEIEDLKNSLKVEKSKK